MRERRHRSLTVRGGAVRAFARTCLLALSVSPGACASGSSEVTEGGTGLRSVAVGGLSSGSRSIEVRNEASSTAFAVPATLTVVWSTLPPVFEQLGIEPTFVDARQGQIGNPQFRRSRIERRSMSTFLECGSGLTGAYADTYDVTLSILVYLAAGVQGSSVVRTTVDAYATARSTNATSVHCTSTGALERRIRELIEERLAAR